MLGRNPIAPPFIPVIDRVPYRDALKAGWYCIEVPDDIPNAVLIDWLEKNGSKAYAFSGIVRRRTIAIEEKDIATLFKLTWY